MKAKFIVDDLNENMTLGRTKSIDKILFNITRFSPDFNSTVKDLIEQGKGITVFTIVGRFIVYLSINPSMSDGDLIFFDTEKNIDKAIDTVNFLFDDNANLLNKFMLKHSELENYYDIDYDLAELSLGDSILN